MILRCTVICNVNDVMVYHNVLLLLVLVLILVQCTVPVLYSSSTCTVLLYCTGHLFAYHILMLYTSPRSAYNIY
jgi:hypothetical protein